MNTYRNTKTGVVIEIPSELRGNIWEKINSPSVAIKTEVKKETATTPKTTKKRTK